MVTLISHGKSKVAVLIDRETAAALKSNARNPLAIFVDSIREISGAVVSLVEIALQEVGPAVREIAQQGEVPFLLGELALAALKEVDIPPSAKLALEHPEGFFLQAAQDRILLAAPTPEGISHGIHEVLEQLGMRWFLPGKLGTVTPCSRDLAISTQETAQRPTFGSRHYQLDGVDEWASHQRIGGHRLPSAHGIPIGEGYTVESHPSLFAFVKGRRVASQLCITNPEILRLAVQETKAYFVAHPDEVWIGMGPNDGPGFCECEGCRAFSFGDWDPFSSEHSVTDRYVHFFNQVLDGIHDAYPEKKIVFYVYHSYMRPPVQVRPNPKIVAAIAPIALCRLHGLDNPCCPEKSYLKEIVASWSALLPEVYERGYWFNLADPGMLFIQTSRLKNEIASHAQSGIKGFRTECVGHWAVEGPSLYVAGRLMWNADADPHQIVEDFCQHLFGPAAEPMQRYFEGLDARLRDCDFHTGGANDILEIYPSDIRAAAREQLREAESLALTSPYRERVALFAKGFGYHEAFAQMLEHRDNGDWAAAYDALQTMDALRATLLAYDHPMLSEFASRSYLKRFFRLPIEQAHQRLSEGGKIVSPLSSKWEFLLDPQHVGEALHYESPDSRGGNWQAISARRSWSTQGLRYYKGLAWHRQTIQVDAAEAAQRLFLWFGGVDEKARVWVNGHLAGIAPGSAFTPFEFDVTKLIQPGENRIVVCVANLQVDEIGTGGIVAPAFLYAPALGDDAVLRNIAPLRPTFP